MEQQYHNGDENGRQFRQRKKQNCPVCGIAVRVSEMEHHFAVEIDRLDKLSTPSKLRKQIQLQKENPIPSTSSSSTEILLDSNPTTTDSSWSTYQKIKINRQSRLKLKSRKRKADDSICPVCNKKTSEEITVHVENCLRRSENRSNGIISDDDDDASIDIEGEEYEWAGQTRIRASTLLDGGYVGLGIGTSMNSSRNITSDEDEDLNVDGDDTYIYGPSQYGERDIIPVAHDNKKEDSNSLYLRNLVIGNNIGHTNITLSNKPTYINADEHTLNNNINNNDDSMNNVSDENQPMNNNSNHNNHSTTLINHQTTLLLSHDSNEQSSNLKIIESLRFKIKDLEFQIKNKSKCLICLDEYKIPVVSICCWHVHCEECWLRTLGARKLCPQCNMITSPTDLRRIYM